MISSRFLAIAFCLLAPSISGAANPVAYDIRPPSSAWSSCPTCGLAHPLSVTGGFLLLEEEAGPAGTLYQVREFKVRSDYGGEWIGSGTYRRSPNLEADMVLDLEIGTGTKTRFSGKVFSRGSCPGR